ncbi:MAG TPA: DUF4286 family protein [Holophagaceae bacterium]|nr:DUF4286 family protein [Holophagaceae bacterium]
MVAYEVTVSVREDLAEPFERYMRDKHIPEILATGCFTRIRFEQASPTLFRTRYEAASRADLDRYLGGHTAHFRQDFLAHFPEGCAPSREIWDPLQVFPG